jgi:thiamine-monophosphate kinase
MDEDWCEKFLEGFLTLAEQHRTALVGGDTTQGPLSITVTVMGFINAAHALRRSGAMVGDGLFVSGAVGAGAGGLAIKMDQRSSSLLNLQPARDLVRKLEWPEPRIALGQWLAGTATSCIDISDGLLQDLGHLCLASRCGALVELERIPLAEGLGSCFNIEKRREFALGGGDDYELLFTAPTAATAQLASLSEQLNLPITRIGQMVDGSQVVVRDRHGARYDVKRAGFEHFTR